MNDEDWCRIVLSMSDGSSRAVNLLRIYKSLMAIFTQCLTDRVLLTNIILNYFMNRDIFIISQLNGLGSTALIRSCHNTLSP